MPRTPIKCIGCGRYKHMDKGHKYTVSDTEYLCQECYDTDRNADEVLPLCPNAGLLSTALFPS
jgi:hypothetical protein